MLTTSHQQFLLGNSQLQVQPKASDISGLFNDLVTCGVAVDICGEGLVWHNPSKTCYLLEDYDIQKSYAKFGVRSGDTYQCPGVNEQCRLQTFDLPAGEKLRLRVKTANWANEVGVILQKPDGGEIHWRAGASAFNNYKEYELFPDGTNEEGGDGVAAAPDVGLPYWEQSGTYTLKMYDTWGDGSNDAPADARGVCAPPSGSDLTVDNCGGTGGMRAHECAGLSSGMCSFTPRSYWTETTVAYTQAYEIATDVAMSDVALLEALFQDMKTIWAENHYCDSLDAIVELCGDEQYWNNDEKKCQRLNIASSSL
jgi:hypothetical protein